MKKEILPTFIMLASVPFVMVLSNSMLIPVLPRLQSAMNLTLFQVGLIITAFSIPAGLVLPVAGYLSDRWGRKVIMIPALFLFGLGGLAAGIFPMMMTQPFMAIMGSRVIQGIGAGGTYQLSMALTGDIFQSSERSKVMGILESANGLGKVISPILGSVVALITWYSPFFVYPALAWPAAAGIYFVCKEPKGNRKSQCLKDFLVEIKDLLVANVFPLIAVFLAGFAVLFLLFGSLAYLSDVLDRTFRLRGLLKGLAIAGPVMATTLTAYGSGIFIRKSIGKFVKPSGVVGMGLIFASMAVIPWFGSVYVLYGSLVALGVGAGLVLPALNLLVTSVAQQSRGTLTCLYGTVRFFGAALGPPALGLGLGLGRAPTFATGAGIALAAAIFLLLANLSSMLPGKVKGEGGEGEQEGSPEDAPQG